MMNLKNNLFNDKKKVLIISFSVIILIVCGVFLYKYIQSQKGSKNMYKENADLDSSSGNSNYTNKTATVYFFYTTWCPHSLSAIPEWEAIVDKYTHNQVNGYTIKLIDVDCTKETVEIENMVNKYDIEGYPTIKMVKDDQIIEFDAKAKFDNIDKFLTTVL